MKRIAIILVVLIILLVGGVAGVYFFAPNMLGGLGIALPGVPTPTPAGGVKPTPTEDPGKNIIVAKRDLEQGTFITSEILLDTKNIKTDRFTELTQDPSKTIFEKSQMSDVIGKKLKVQLFAGDHIRKDMLTEPGMALKIPTAEPGHARPKAYPFKVDNFSGVANQISEGDLVDIVATFTVKRRVYLPSLPNPEPTAPPPSIGSGGEIIIPPTPVGGNIVAAAGGTEDRDFFSTKTIVQRAKVMAILRPPVPTPTPVPDQDKKGAAPAAPPAPLAPPPVVDESTRQMLLEGQWQIVVLALTDQQAELIELAQQLEARITLVLRGSGDQPQEKTIGATFDLLVSEFGIPMPEPENPFVFAPEVLTPLPTRTPVADRP